MHKENDCMIIFKGPDGKAAVRQILNAKPVKNKYTESVQQRSKKFIEAMQNKNAVSVAK